MVKGIQATYLALLRLNAPMGNMYLDTEANRSTVYTGLRANQLPSKVYAMTASLPHRYNCGVTFITVKKNEDDQRSLPVYTLLLSEDLLSSLDTKGLRYGEQLKVEATHGTRQFKVWFYPNYNSSMVRIEEYINNEWVIVHTYRPL